MGAIVLRDYRDTRFGRASERMIVTRRADRSYREVEGANPGHDSYKPTHVGLILIGKIPDCMGVVVSLGASFSPIGSKLRTV